MTSPEIELAIAGATRKLAASYVSTLNQVDVFLALAEEVEAESGSDTYGGEVPERLGEIKSCRDQLAEAIERLEREANVCAALGRHPLLVDVLRRLRVVSNSEGAGTALHEQLSLASRAIEDGLAGFQPKQAH